MANTGEEGLSVGQRVRSWASWLSSYVFGDRGIGGHATGVVMVVSVALIWVVSSEFIQYIFGGDIDFSKPFFLTYFNTTLFASYLLTLLWKPLYRRITAEGNEDGGPGQWWPSTTLHEIGPRGGGVEKEVTELIDDIDDDEDSSVSTDTEALIARMTTSTTSDGTMPMRQMAKLAMFFCPLWFVANYTFNLGLMLTSVSSSSTISTMTGLFTLIIGVFVGAEAFSLVKVASVTLKYVFIRSLHVHDRHSVFPSSTHSCPVLSSPLCAPSFNMRSVLQYRWCCSHQLRRCLRSGRPAFPHRRSVQSLICVRIRLLHLLHQSETGTRQQG